MNLFITLGTPHLGVSDYKNVCVKLVTNYQAKIK